MKKALIAGMAAALAIGPAPLLAASGQVAHADPRGDYCSKPPVHIQDPNGNNTDAGYLATLRNWEAVCGKAPTTAPPAAPGTGVNPSTAPAGVNPPATGNPKTAGRMSPPKGVDAPPQAVAAAKSAPATRIDPANPPKPPTRENFAQRVHDLITKRNANIDVVRVNNEDVARPRHWGYVDYDDYHRPMLFNPISEAMTFRFFYSGDYREVYVPAGDRIVLDVAVVGVFPFTAVSENYLSVGSFNGGAWIPPEGWSGPPAPDYTPPRPPTVYTDVTASIPATNQSVQVGQVELVGHNATQPAGSQDTFMLDDSTLAWGQVADPRNGGQVTVARAQSLPGVGPIDNGSSLASLAVPQKSNHSPWPWVVGGTLVVLVLGGAAIWLTKRRREASTESDLPPTAEDDEQVEVPEP